MRYRNHLGVLTSRWRGKLIPAHLLKFWEENSEKEACRLLKMNPGPLEYTFVEPVIADLTSGPEDVPSETVDDSEWGVTAQFSADDVLMHDFLDKDGDISDDDTPQAVESKRADPELAVDTSSTRNRLDFDLEVSELSRPQMNPLDMALKQLRPLKVTLNTEPLVRCAGLYRQGFSTDLCW